LFYFLHVQVYVEEWDADADESSALLGVVIVEGEGQVMVYLAERHI
jgi:hypothetical protein